MGKDDCPQRDAGVHRPAEIDVADGAGIGTTAGRLELVDDLHGPDLRGPRDGAGREASAKRVEGRLVGEELPGDVARDVHDMAVALDRHHVGELHRTDLGDAADVVATEVDEHDVLGPLLRVGEQTLGEGPVLFRGGAARTRPGERAHRHRAVDEAHHDLRRAADERRGGGAEEEHERARVHHPQRPVELDRRVVEGDVEAAAEHHLEDVAGADVLDRRVDGGEESLTAEGGGCRAVAEAAGLVAGADVGRCGPIGRREELRKSGVDPPTRLGPAVLDGGGGAVADVGENDDIERLRDVVEDHEPVVEGEAQIGERTVVGGGVGEILDVPDRVVGRIPDDAAGERGEFVEVGRAKGGHAALELGERVVRFKLLLRAAGEAVAADGDLPPTGLEEEERIGAEKAVAPHLLSADDALEQAATGAGVESGEGRQRCQPVGEQSAPHRHEAVGRREGPEPSGVGEAGVLRGRCSRHGAACRAVALRADIPRLPRHAPHLHPAGRTSGTGPTPREGATGVVRRTEGRRCGKGTDMIQSPSPGTVCSGRQSGPAVRGCHEVPAVRQSGGVSHHRARDGQRPRSPSV